MIKIKKFILGISLFLGGIIGFSGWIISSAIINSGMSGIPVIGGLRSYQLLILGVFIIISLVGLLISYIESKKV